MWGTFWLSVLTLTLSPLQNGDSSDGVETGCHWVGAWHDILLIPI